MLVSSLFKIVGRTALGLRLRNGLEIYVKYSHWTVIHMSRPKIGLLTEKQVKVIKLRARGLSLREVASILGVSHQDVALTEKRALRNIRLAWQTLIAYYIATAPVKVILNEGVRHVDIPRLIIEEADKAGVKVKADISLMLKLIWRKARNCVERVHVSKPILVIIDREGNLEVYPYHEVQYLYQELERL